MTTRSDLLQDEDALVRRFEGLVVQLADDVAKRHRMTRFMDDLLALGREGLIVAARTYDPTRGTAFSTWAWYKVRSRILDGSRDLGLVKRRRSVSVAIDQTFSEHQSLALEDPVGGDDFGSIVSDLDAMVQDAAAIVLLFDPDDTEEMADTRREPVDVALERQTVASYVRGEVEALGEPHRTFVKKSFLEGKSMSQIAKEQSCSKSWVCRIRREGVEMLRKRIDADAVRE